MLRIFSRPYSVRCTAMSMIGTAAGFFMSVAAAGAQVLPVESGIVFRCTAPQLIELQPLVDAYLTSLGVDLHQVSRQLDAPPGTLSYTLAESTLDGGTLDLIDQANAGLTDVLVVLPAANGQTNTVLTVSQKEIVYAMLQPDRASLFSGRACDVQALKDHVGVRQNIVAWSESLSWTWPNGGSARWNNTYWDHGDLVKGQALHDAVNDAFMAQERYAIGCYAATKLVMMQGILDYYRRIKNDLPTVALVETRLMRDGEPLSYIEPGAMWSFESSSTPQDRARPGKLLSIQSGVATRNFIPGDWTYFLNTDPVTYEKIGYEGSNAVYLGRGKFDDFYNDHHHSYTYKEKKDEVYQWRNEVFSRYRDIAKVKPLTAAELDRLGNTPAQLGIQLDLRASPLLFGYQDLP